MEIKIMTNFIDSNILMAIITLFVGGITLFIYYKEKNGKKRDVAKLILQEVRYAENKIKEYRTHKNYKLHYRLLPTNNWNSNIHLFIKDFEQSQVDLISSFYSQAGYIDNVIQKISDDKLKQKPIPNNQFSIPIITNLQQPVGQPPTVQPIQQPVGQPIFQAIPQLQHIMFSDDARLILDETSVSIELIYNTPTISNLKELSEKKWYQI